MRSIWGNVGKNPDAKVGVVRRLSRGRFLRVKKISAFLKKKFVDNQSFASIPKKKSKKPAALEYNIKSMGRVLFVTFRTAVVPMSHQLKK